MIRHRIAPASCVALLLLGALLETGAEAMEIPRPKAGGSALGIDPRPRFDLSPHLYMQFMEPLGTTDGSVAAAWDFHNDRWRRDVVEVTRELAPAMIRWGGCFSSYYRWKEGVGPRSERVPMVNLLWGGVETNQVGTGEFVDFCRRVGAEPLMCVNFESDGRKRWARAAAGCVRSAGPEEAAAWVDYCNNPANELRLSHGVKEPYDIRFWQIGNETSYDRKGFDLETAAGKTLEFARAMRKADPGITIIGWGDSGWARRMIEVAGEQLQYVAFHNMFNPDGRRKDSPLRGIEYRKDPARTWDHLMRACRVPEAKIRRMRREVAGLDMPLALTECHFALPGRNRCEVLSTWAAGVANARILNVHERNGDILKIATLADFCGTRWQVNAVMIPVPRGRSYMMPVARVMSLYRTHSGEKALVVASAPDDLDVTASRTGGRVFLHVVNTNRTRPVVAELAVDGMKIGSGKVFEIAADPEFEVFEAGNVLAPKRKDLRVTSGSTKRRVEPTSKSAERPSAEPLVTSARWTFPPASVSAVELHVAE